MFTPTPWSITHWNGDTVSAALGVGIGGSVAEIGLSNRGTLHVLECYGVTGSLGAGISLRRINLSSSAMGFRADARTHGGTLYQNDATVPNGLTLGLLRSSEIHVQGLELTILDEGVAGYLVIFASTGATLSTFLGGGGLLSQGIAVATCRALAFLSVGQAGLPNIGMVGYRYRVIGA